MRVEYTPIALPGGITEDRPIVDVVFNDDPDAIPYAALIDSGSLRTVASRSAFDIDLGEPDERIETLRFASYCSHNVPVYPLSMTVKSPDPRCANIPLPSVAVAVVDEELPFVLLGAGALAHLVLVLREHDQVLHVKPAHHFAEAPHFEDPLF